MVFFNRLAEIVEQYVKKGTKLYVEGRLQTRSWEQDGVKRYSTEVVANEMQMLDSRGGVSQDFGSQMAAAHSPASQQQAATPPQVSTILTTTFHSSDHPPNVDLLSALHGPGAGALDCCAKRDSDEFCDRLQVSSARSFGNLT